MLLPDLAKEIEAKLDDNSSSTRTQIDLKPKSTRIGTSLAQPVFGLCNSSSAYKQMVKSIYENRLDRLLRVKNHLATASREAPVFDVYPDPVKSPQDSLDRLLHVENQSATASREAPVFDVYPDPVESSQDSLDFITNALAKMQLKSCRSHTLAELLDNL